MEFFILIISLLKQYSKGENSKIQEIPEDTRDFLWLNLYCLIKDERPN